MGGDVETDLDLQPTCCREKVARFEVLDESGDEVFYWRVVPRMQQV
jgi:hypothetical protein